MSRPVKKNLIASVRQRLLIESQKRKEPFDLILTRYGIERLLYRLSQSVHADRFLLKGAMLFLVWNETAHRPTRDVDLLGSGPAEADVLEAIFREVCEVAVEPDGVEFLADSIRANPIREAAFYRGVRITLEARLGNVRISIQADVGFGDAITPGPEVIIFPTLLDFTAPQLRAYPVYTVVAEKLEAMVLLGEANSRMKDFYDLWFLGRFFEFDGETLVAAIRATFARRGTPLPDKLPLGLREEFAPVKVVQWRAFLRKSGLQAPEFADTLAELRRFCAHPLHAAALGEGFDRIWKPALDWT